MEQNVSTEKKSSEVIVVTSGKGGVGKTTTSANVGTGLAKAGSKVCLIDTDIGLRNLDVVMGLENRIFPLQGVIWYQGKSNLESSDEYADILS